MGQPRLGRKRTVQSGLPVGSNKSLPMPHQNPTHGINKKWTTRPSSNLAQVVTGLSGKLLGIQAWQAHARPTTDGNPRDLFTQSTKNIQK